MNHDILALTMESDTFNELKLNFNRVLRKTLFNMLDKESRQAELTVKLKIQLDERSVPDCQEARYNATRDIIKPTFTHKVSSVMQIKSEENGLIGGDFELVLDKESGDYALKPINDGQISVFDNISEFYNSDGGEFN